PEATARSGAGCAEVSSNGCCHEVESVIGLCPSGAATGEEETDDFQQGVLDLRVTEFRRGRQREG
ncbi:MAG: hypothetical protein AAF628_05860, partial [Planctomycetota bacterium]